MNRIWNHMPAPLDNKFIVSKLVRRGIQFFKNFVHSSAWLLGIVGAKNVGDTHSGNSLLRLNRNYALGSKGTVLEIPKDGMIYENVKKTGFWELEESEFLARGLKNSCRQASSAVAFLDIGANSGLVTLQAMNLAKTQNEVFLFEPVPQHISAIRHNLKNLSNIHVNAFALSNRNGITDIFTEAANHGNTSVFNSVVPDRDKITTSIQLVDTKEYCDRFLHSFERFVIKCDTQGMDALILSNLPERIWKNCECAVIEVWSLTEISESHVRKLLSMCEDFEYVGWHPDARIRQRVELVEVGEFWLNKSGLFKNLYLSKSLQDDSGG